MRIGLKIFDSHTHLGDASHSGRSHSAEMLVAQMDEYGVERSLAIPFPMVRSYKETHDKIGAAIRAYPDRFAGAACLNPFLPESEFRDEVRRCAQEYGFRALKLQPQYQPIDPASTRANFFFETAIENHMAVVCHTGAGVPYALPSLFMLPARNYPELKIVLSHCGGGGLFVQEAIIAALFCPNIYLELSTLLPHQVLQVLNQVPADRLMIGSDLPENMDVELGKIVNLRVPEEDKRAILWSTASHVFAGHVPT